MKRFRPSIRRLPETGGITKFFITLFLLLFVPLKSAAQNAPAANLSGVVRDEFNGLIVGAEINLYQKSGRTQTVFSDNQGSFNFENLPFGRYTLQISAEGFARYEKSLDLNSILPVSFSVILYPTVIENVEIKSYSENNLLDSETLAGTQVITENELADLPDDPEELSRELQNRAASAGSVPGNAVVTVDGFLNEGRLPSKSAIREVRVNPNLFSAEHSFPPFRGGRIEIITKPGAGELTGSAFFNFNDDSFNARHPFARERAETNTKLYGFQLGSPIIKDRSGFFVDFEKRDIDEASIVNAVILDNNFQRAGFSENVPNPQRLLIGSARNDWQIGKDHSLIFRYDFNRTRVEGQGIGGLNLSSRAFDYEQTENNFRFSETAVINAKTVNELRIGLTLRDTEQRAVSDAPVIDVAGAFTAGGADLQRFSLKETDLEISNNLVTEAGNHILKIGTQIFNYRTNDRRRENQNGTFFFGGREISDVNGSTVFISGLEQYRRTLLELPGGVPTRFSVNLGEPSVSVNQWLFAAFIQDEWRVNKKVLISLGLRAESQTLPKDQFRFAPRLSIAYSPDKKQNWAIRARAGIFYQRISDALSLESERLDGRNQQRILIDDPAFPNPFPGGTNANPVTVRRILDPNLKAPGSLQMRVELQRQLPQGWSVSSSYSVTRGWSQLRSRNINAPLISLENPDPGTAPRPFGVPVNIFQFESSGRLEGNVLYIGVNQNTYKLFSLNAGYLNFDFKTDTDGAFSFPQTSYDLKGEFAAPSWQTQHYMFLSSSVNLPWKLRLATSVNASSGTPFNVTTGRDNNGDGIFNDRPRLTSPADLRAIQTRFGFLNPDAVNGDLQRNIGTNPANFTVSMNLRRTFVLRKEKEKEYKLTVHVRANNLFNRTNPHGVSGVLNSPFFGRAFSAQTARQIEFGLRFSF